MSKNSEQINRTKDKRDRNVLISTDDFTRHEALSEACRLYHNGALHKANKLLTEKVTEKDMRYECLKCVMEEIILASDVRKDGRSCKFCGGKMSPQGLVVTPRDETIKQLRMIADDLEKGCGGFNFLVGCDLTRWRPERIENLSGNN